MTRHPCTAPHGFGHAQNQQAEPETGSMAGWTDDEIQKAAALEFEAWDTSDCPLPSDQEWIDEINPFLVSLRVAWLTMGKTKPELVAMVERMSAGDILRTTMNALDSTVDRMHGYHELASAAQARLYTAAIVVSLKREGRA